MRECGARVQCQTDLPRVFPEQVIKCECLVLAADDDLNERRVCRTTKAVSNKRNQLDVPDSRGGASEQTCLEAPGAVHF